MPNEYIFRVLLTVLPYLFVMPCLAPQPEMSADAFGRAGTFISSTGRPLERALFAFHFAHGGRDAVIAKLTKFQNRDGGFASDLDGDTRWCGSSPMGTMIGLCILNEVKAPVEDPHVQAAVRCLLANFDDKKGYCRSVHYYAGIRGTRPGQATIAGAVDKAALKTIRSKNRSRQPKGQGFLCQSEC